MPELSWPLLLAVFATFFVAGLVKGVTGMGLPTVAMGVLGALISPLAAASLLLAPSFVTNLWQFLAGPPVGALLRRFWPMMLAIVAGTMLGASWLAGDNTTTATTLLGLALVAYAAVTLLLRPRPVPPRLEPWLSPPVGAVTGLVSGVTGVFVIPAVPYLQALALPRDMLVQALGLSFTVSTMALALGLGVQGAFEVRSLLLSALAVAPALAGMGVGQALRGRISPSGFRRVFLVGLLLLGIEMAARPFF